MTANLSEPKTFSIVAGALPAGLAIGGSDGVISGTPTTAGSFPFTVEAAIDADPHQRSDTKALTIDVRPALVVAGPRGAQTNGLPPSVTGLNFLAGTSLGLPISMPSFFAKRTPSGGLPPRSFHFTGPTPPSVAIFAR
jgi:hypothetical protein